MFKISFPSEEPIGKLPADELRSKILEANKAAQCDLTTPREFTVSHAQIDGRLDLSNIQTEHGALLGLIFHDCEFLDRIVLENSTVASLTFSRCKLKTLMAESAHVLGGIKFDSVQSSEDQNRASGQIEEENWHRNRGPESRPVEEKDGVTTSTAVKQPQGRCEIRLSKAKIRGGIEIKNSRIVGKALRTNIDFHNTPLNFALSLESAKIGSSLHIDENSAVLGGVSVGGAHIGQNIFVVGARILAGEGPAFRAQRAEIDGFVAFRNINPPDKSRSRTEIIGSLDFMGAKVKSAMDVSGAYLQSRSSNDVAITLQGAEIDGFLANRDKVTGGLPTDIVGIADFRNAHIMEDAYFDGTRFRKLRFSETDQNKTDPYAALLNFYQTKVDGSLTLFCDFSGPCNLNLAHIGRNLTLGYPETERTMRLRTPATDHLALMMENMRVGGQLAVQSLVVDSKNNIEVLKNALKGKDPIQIRKLPLSFLEVGELIEFAVKVDNRTHYGYAIDTPKRLLLMDGGGQPVASPLIKNHVELTLHDDIKNYFRLFCSIVVGPAGPFRIVEPGDWFCSQLPEELANQVKDIELQPAQPTKDRKEIARCTATIWYGSNLFETTLTLLDNFMVEMPRDVQIGSNIPDLTWSASPLYYGINGSPKFNSDWDLPPPIPGEPKTGLMSKKLRKRLLAATPSANSLAIDKPAISLRNTHVHELADYDGNNWPRTARLDLAGFTYESMQITTDRHSLIKKRNEKRTKMQKKRVAKLLSRPTRGRPELIGKSIGFCIGIAIIVGILYGAFLILNTMIQGIFGSFDLFDLIIPVLFILVLAVVRNRSVNSKLANSAYTRRRQFLRLQYEGYKPNRHEFNPQPFEQLARVFRHQGQEEEYRRISRLKSSWRNGTVIAPLWRPFVWLYGLCFGYGYSLPRGVVTFLVALWLGWIGTGIALDRQMLALNSSADALLLSGEVDLAEKVCTTEINKALFAMDKFLPLVELGQERICRVRLDRPGAAGYPPLPEAIGFQDVVQGTLFAKAKNWFSNIATWKNDLLDKTSVWQTMSTMYKLLGWIISSLLILTFSKIFRRATGE